MIVKDIVKTMLTLTVTEEYENQRLDVFITRICDLIPSRSFASKLIFNKKIMVNNKIEKPSYKVTTNQIVLIIDDFLNEINSEPVGEKIPLTILFEDSHLIVINKAAGMVVHPGAGVNSGTLVNAILAHCGSTLPSLGNAARAGIVHRLDRDTSGVLVVAKSQRALTELSKQFAEHLQTRIYQALVYGVPTPREGKIETWHGRDPKNRIKYAVQTEGIGKKAILNYSVKEQLGSQLFSLVECRLFTGRTHQIRVQMASHKHGIVGDALYSQLPGQIKNKKELFSFITKNISRQMLHAYCLGFKHPITNEEMNFYAPLPPDFENALNFLRTIA
ncbi:MAG: RluA family pseudouridine synthase [Bdellovibrionota bacterium]